MNGTSTMIITLVEIQSPIIQCGNGDCKEPSNFQVPGGYCSWWCRNDTDRHDD